MNQLKIVKIAKALADPTRLRILRAIQEKCELNCSQICEKFPLSQPTISHHIKALEDAGLISVRKKAQYHILAANCELLEEFARDLAGLDPSEPAPTAGSKKAGPRKRSPRASAAGR